MSKTTYHPVPGRGLLTQKSLQDRISHLQENGFDLPYLWSSNLDVNEIQHNIESYIGSVEVPVGLVGPLTYLSNGVEENVFVPAGTLEGALVASMNRGAKAISMSGGFQAQFIHQRMVRVPLFFLQNKQDALRLAQWIDEHFNAIKKLVESYSNHAKLIDLDIQVRNTEVHVGFVYTTGDASGQNMTTTCTWHGIMWIKHEFEAHTSCRISDAIIEGNGSSDKKVSAFLLHEGRGCKVIASCDLEESVIQRVLRTSSNAILKCYEPSHLRTKELGMLAFNINVANAIAAIFVATGQDLASIHESSMAQLNLEKSTKGLKLTLILPSLVIGTVGGGTHLSDRQDALKLMGCNGTGKIERFAELIAGFALSLEISTYAAIVSGEFAKAHEKLGRNKPIHWLTKADFNESLIRKIIALQFQDGLKAVDLQLLETENGMLTLLTKRVNKKFTGFIRAKLNYGDTNKMVVIKNKATDVEVIKGLQLVSASVNTELAQRIFQYKDQVEYSNCHRKELAVYNWLNARSISSIPVLYGTLIEEKTESFLLCLADLSADSSLLLDTENKTECWTKAAVSICIQSIATIHNLARNHADELFEVNFFDPQKAVPLYQLLAEIVHEDHGDQIGQSLLQLWTEFEHAVVPISLWKTLVHNDFNPRNVALRPIDGTYETIFYDWELAVFHYPHRDIVEFLAFVADQFENDQLHAFLVEHEQFACGNEITHRDWWMGYRYTLLELIFTRMTFYVAAHIVIETKFAHKVLINALRLVNLVENELEKA